MDALRASYSIRRALLIALNRRDVDDIREKTIQLLTVANDIENEEDRRDIGVFIMAVDKVAQTLLEGKR